MSYNPQAFPTPTVLAPDGSTEQHGNPGMTLRDYFAAQAMAGILAKYTSPATSDLAKWAVGYADALIKELAKATPEKPDKVAPDPVDYIVREMATATPARLQSILREALHSEYMRPCDERP